MAKLIKVSYDFSFLEMLRVRLQNLVSDPSNVGGGALYYNSVANRVLFSNGTAYLDYTNRANHTGTQAASTISDLATTVQGYTLSQFGAPTGALSLNAQRLISMADPVNPQDGATRNYVDSVIQATDWKPSVRLATTGNITLSGLQTVDSVVGSADDRVLVWQQSTASQNGLYLMKSGAWVRTLDADGALELTPRATVVVEEGTLYSGKKFTVTNSGTISIGSTAITWALTDAGSSYTQGTGIVLDTSISIDTTVVARKYSTNIGDGTATSYVITHNLGTKDVTVAIRDASSDAFVEAEVTATSTSQATVSFAVAPSSNQYRVTVVG